MRHIERYSEPEILIRKKQEWTDKFLADEKNKRPDSSKYRHRQILNRLFTMSHNKCSYCETMLKERPSEIDHLIEVSERKDLAFDWDNLCLACDNCNDKVPNRDISVDSVLNPCVDSDEEIRKHIMFSEGDEQITYLSDKGEQTIKKFRLSSPLLDGRRRIELQRFLQDLLRIKGEMEKFNRPMNASEKERLQGYAKNDRSYSLMFMKTLAKYNIL